MELKKQATEFWQAWQTQEPQLIKLSPREFVDEANELLAHYVDGVSIELEGETDEGKLVFTAQGIVDNFAKVSALVETATTRHFDVVAFREPMMAGANGNPNFDIAQFQIGMDGLELAFGDLQIQPFVGRYVIHLAIKINKSYDEEQFRHLQNMAFIILDHVIGEWDFVTKIGRVDFVETLDGRAVNAKDLPTEIQRLWVKELGHTGEYPSESSYVVAQVEESEEQDAMIFTINQSSKALLADKKLSWCVMVTTDFDNQEQLETARDLQDALIETMVKNPLCIDALVEVNLSQSSRTVYLYCKDGTWGAKTAQQIVDNFAQVQSLVKFEYDPAWSWYKI